MKQKLHTFVWRGLSALTFTVLSTLNAFSQPLEKTSFFEAGITVAPSNFLGDLGGHYGRGTTFLKDNNFPMTKAMFGAFVAYHPAEWLGFRFSGNMGNLEGDDAIISGKGGLEEARKLRNSNFRSKLAEAFVAAEIYPTVFLEYEPSDLFHKLRPYGLIGVGVFHFNPQGQDPLNGQWVDLKQLRTEGQGMTEYPDRKEYKLTQLNIPMGVGVKYFLSEKTALSLEVVHRKTFTDYIDDVSTTYIDPALFYNYMNPQQAAIAERMANKSVLPATNTQAFSAGDKRGTPTNNDAYYSFGFKLSIRLGNAADNRWKNSTRCPVHY